MGVSLFPLDYVILAIVLVSLIYGAYKGALHFITVILAAVATFILFPAANIFALQNIDFFKDEIIWKIVLFLALFIGMSIILKALSSIVESLLKAVFIGWINNLLGAVFMLLLSTFAIYFTFMLLAMIMSQPIASFPSKILVFLADIYSIVIGFIPPSVTPV